MKARCVIFGNLCQDRLGLLVVSLQALSEGLGRVVLALGELLATLIILHVLSSRLCVGAQARQTLGLR